MLARWAEPRVLSRSWLPSRGLRPKERGCRKRRGKLNHAEDGQRGAEPKRESLAEQQAPESEAREQAEDVQSHRLPCPPKCGHDAGQKRLSHVVSEGQQSHEQRRDQHGDVKEQEARGEPSDSEPGRDQPAPSPAVGGSSDDGSEDEAGHTVPEQRETDTDLAEAVALCEVESEPGEDAGVEDRIEEDIDVRPLSAEGHEECAIAAQDVHHRRRWGRRGLAGESTIRQQEAPPHQAGETDNKTKPTPAERGLEERAEGR